jgi:hypothetical protein
MESIERILAPSDKTFQQAQILFLCFSSHSFQEKKNFYNNYVKHDWKNFQVQYM